MQVVGYRTLEPRLLLASDGHVDPLALEPGDDLAYTLGERHCAGRIDWETDPPTHDACDRPDAPECPAHTVPWSAVSNADSDEEHAVYLAAFAPATFKVGVTRSWRLDTRLREQGADRAAHVHTVSDGRIARAVESDIAETVGDKVRVPRKVAGLHRTVDDDAWEHLLADHDVIEEFSFDYGFTLDTQPVPETMLTGRVVGTKGRVLVLERAGTTYAVDMRDLVGFELAAGTGGDVQSSLTSF